MGICKGRSSGVSVHSGGQGQFLENNVYSNELHGVMVQSESTPLFRANQIHDNRGCGFVAHSTYELAAYDKGDTTQLKCGPSMDGNALYRNGAGNVKVVDA